MTRGSLYFLLKDQHFPWSNFLLKNQVEKHAQVPTAQSQQPSVYEHHWVSLSGIPIDVIRYEPHTLSLRPFIFFFQQLHWFLQLSSCFIKWYEKERSTKLRIQNGGWHETPNLLWCFTWNKTKNVNKPSRVRSADWRSSLNYFACVGKAF